MTQSTSRLGSLLESTVSGSLVSSQVANGEGQGESIPEPFRDRNAHRAEEGEEASAYRAVGMWTVASTQGSWMLSLLLVNHMPLDPDSTYRCRVN